MDYQPMQPMPPAQPMPPVQPMQPMDRDSSMKMWWIIGVVVVLALGAWYYYGVKAPAVTEQSAETTSAVDQATIPALTGGNTTADISADLNTIPDTSAALDADAAAAAQAVQGL